MSIKQVFFDILIERVDGMGTNGLYVDILSVFRQVRSIGRLHRHLPDPVTETPDWLELAYCL